MIKNILVIMCDQLRKDCLGCYGNTDIKTPHIDSISKTGTRFDRNYVANPICMPSRHSLFSGMYPRNHGVWTNGLLVKDEGNTIMHHLKTFGYQSASIGKIHFEPMDYKEENNSTESLRQWEKDRGLQNFHGPYWGFDHIEMQGTHGTVNHHMKSWFLEKGGTPDMMDIVPLSGAAESGIQRVPNRLHPSAYIGERTINYLENIRDKEKPFFLVASFTDPHHPFVATEESMKDREYKDIKTPIGTPKDLETRPPHYKSHLDGAWSRAGISDPKHMGGIPDEWRIERTNHTYAMIELVDENIGKILEALKKEGLEENTAIIFTADHGELLGDFGLWHKGPFFYEGLVSTPLIIKLPKGTKQESDALISTVDIVPTICDLLEIDTPYYADGLSQIAVLNNQSENVRDACLIEYRNGYHDNDCNSKVLVKDRYKYVLYENGEEELTDLDLDPKELKNIIKDEGYRAIAEDLRQELLSMLLKTESKKPYQISHA